MSLVIGFGPGLELGGPVGGRGGERVRATASSASLATGLHTRARHFAHQGALHGIEITLAPWVAHQIFSTSMSDLADTVVDPADVLGPGFHSQYR